MTERKMSHYYPSKFTNCFESNKICLEVTGIFPLDLGSTQGAACCAMSTDLFAHK